MLNINEVIETNKMIHEMNLDVRTITMGISLLDCVGDDVEQVCDNIHRKIISKAENLVQVGNEIEREFGIPVVNKRISVTPIALVGGRCCRGPEDFVRIARELDRCAREVGVNFTAGLPVVRTSPDHGTAYEMAGKDMADPQSMKSAIYMAIDIFNNRISYDRLMENRLVEEKKEEDERPSNKPQIA